MIDPAVADVLTVLEEWLEPNKVVDHVSGFAPESVAKALDVLRSNGLVVDEESPEADADEQLARQWGPWAPEGPLFHYATQDTDYSLQRFYPTDRDESGAPHKPEDPPDREHVLFSRHSEAERLLLPRRPTPLDRPYGAVLYDRRTHRSFTDEPVAAETLAALLSIVFGPTDFIDSGRSALMRRTSAAGGSRQEIDAYVGIRNVVDVAPGMYRYDCLEHSLELCTPELTAEQVVQCCAGLEWTGEAPFIVVLVATLDRMLSKYRTPRCYRVILLNAGHLGQTFALTATALGLGPFQTAAFHDSRVVEICRLDNISVTPLYVLGAGHVPEHPMRNNVTATMDTFRRTTIRESTQNPLRPTRTA